MCDHNPAIRQPFKLDTRQFCDSSKPPSLERPHLVSYSSSPLLAKLRVAILEHLKDLETNLSQLDPYLKETTEENDRQPTANKNCSSSTGEANTPHIRQRRRGSLSAAAIEETRAKVQHVLNMLGRIRSDVYSYLPELPSMDDVRSHIQGGMPTFQDFEISLLRKETLEKLMSDKTPTQYLPTLKSHLDTLHDHIRSLKLPSSFSNRFPSFTTQPSNGIIADFLYKLQDPGLLTDPLKTPLDVIGTLGESRPSAAEAVELEYQFDLQVKRALKESNDGQRLIAFDYVPQRYRNNHYLKTGYRYVVLTSMQV